MKYKFFALSDSALSATGYGNVSRNLLKRLSKDDRFEVTQLCWNQQIQPLKKAVLADGEELEFNMIPGGKAHHGQDTLQEYLKQFNPHICWILLDTFMLHPWIHNIDFTGAKTIFYFPSDGDYFPLECDKILRRIDYPVAMAKFGQEQVKRLHNIDAHYIPHGVNTKEYVPLSEEEKKVWKTTWSNSNISLHNKFIVGVVARNQGRKNLQATIKAFAKFAEGKEDALLLLHMDMLDPAGVCNLWNLIQRLKIENKVLNTGIKWFRGFSNEEMTKLYGIMDCFFLTTTGEGFGIPIIEAMSCGVPVLATDCTTTKELILDHQAGMSLEF